MLAKKPMITARPAAAAMRVMTPRMAAAMNAASIVATPVSKGMKMIEGIGVSSTILIPNNRVFV